MLENFIYKFLADPSAVVVVWRAHGQPLGVLTVPDSRGREAAASHAQLCILWRRLVLQSQTNKRILDLMLFPQKSYCSG